MVESAGTKTMNQASAVPASGPVRPSCAVRVRPDPVHRDGRAVRAPPAVRQRHRSGGGRHARPLRGGGPLRAGRALAALGADAGHLRAPGPEAGLLPVDGVSHRPRARQQRHQPAARSGRRPDRQAARRRVARRRSRRSPTRAWATAGSGGWRPASSTRWPRCSCLRWVTGCATSTASSSNSSRTAGRTSARTTGCAGETPGKSRVRTSRWRSS